VVEEVVRTVEEDKAPVEDEGPWTLLG